MITLPDDPDVLPVDGRFWRGVGIGCLLSLALWGGGAWGVYWLYTWYTE